MPNTKGGKKHKRNKKQNDYVEKTLRLKEEGQEYAQITKCLGNCRFTVMCFDGKERMATMCGGMRKRRFVNQNDIVLVSLREWQDEKCDIIDNYDDNLTKKLKSKGLVPDSIKLDSDKPNDLDIDDDNMGFVFSTDIPNSDSEEEIIKNSSSDEESEEEKIDIDDI
jgi:translation initiation factor 1A